MSNIYSYTADQTSDTYAPYVDVPGNEAGQVLACIVSSEPLSDSATTALTSAVTALGYGSRTCAFAVINAVDGQPPLDARNLFTLIEGLDPLLVIGADAESVRLLSQAYRTDLPALALCEGTASPTAASAATSASNMAAAPRSTTAKATAAAASRSTTTPAARLLGRDAVGFASFESMLDAPDAKQQAWAHLKKLPRF